MTELPATVRNEAGIHCRPSSAIVQRARDYEGTIRVRAESGECDLRSVLGLLALALEKGDTVTIQVEGPNEEETCRELVGLFETPFDFPPRSR